MFFGIVEKGFHVGIGEHVSLYALDILGFLDRMREKGKAPPVRAAL